MPDAVQSPPHMLNHFIFTTVSISQVRKLRHRDVWYIAQGHSSYTPGETWGSDAKLFPATVLYPGALYACHLMVFLTNILLRKLVLEL